jgi:alkylhydroperoxidase/carboxymuconolactone decarboxylase family protein YurZ
MRRPPATRPARRQGSAIAADPGTVPPVPGDGGLSAAQREIRDEFVRRRGYWADDWQLILELAPEIMAAYTDLSAYAWETGSLDAKTREFMYIATTAAVTHIHPIGIRTHGRNALRAGATPRELLTVLALLAGLGMAGYQLAVEVLEEVSPGSTAIQPCPGERFVELRTEYERVFGVWDEQAASAIRADPEFFARFLRWAGAARVSGVLTPRVVALISIAANASVTHLDRKALAREIRAALALGVTPAEILEVCSMTSGVSVHSLTVGVPIIADLIREEAATQPAGPDIRDAMVKGQNPVADTQAPDEQSAGPDGQGADSAEDS